MTYSPSACPICHTLVQDPLKEKCDKCDWQLGIENSLDPSIRNSLVEWAMCHYQRLRKIELKEDYYQCTLDGRLNRQREDIDRLQKMLDNILTQAPGIDSVLRSKQTDIDQENNSSTTIETSIISTGVDSNLPASEPQDAVDPHIQEIEPPSIDPDDIDSTSISSHAEETSLKIPELTKAQQEIAADYNHNISQFVDKHHVKKTKATASSINTSWISENKIAVLEEADRGNYWIFNYGEFTYLVPDEDNRITDHRLDTVSIIFHLDRYNSNYNKIQLIKPAIVSINPNTNPQTWRLQQQGELAFS
jgi:hypothetical protein